MSLETINKKLHDIEKIPLWKFFLLGGILPALISLAIFQSLDSSPLQPIDHPLVKFLLVLIFIPMYMTIIGGGVVIGIGLCWFLLNFNKQFYQNQSRINPHPRRAGVLPKTLQTRPAGSGASNPVPILPKRFPPPPPGLTPAWF